MGFWTITAGDVVSLLGLLLAGWGLWCTYQQAAQASRASDSASRAVAELRARLAALDAVAELSGAIDTMDIARGQMLDQQWAGAADSCALARRRVIGAIAALGDADEARHRALRVSVQQLSTAEGVLCRLVRRPGSAEGSAQHVEVEAANRDIMDRLSELLASLRRDGGT